MFNLDNIIQEGGTIPNTKNTKLAKIVNNVFLGFFDKELHQQEVFENYEEGVLKKEYIEISDIFWNSLLEGQTQGKEIRFLTDTNRLGLYTKKPMPEGLVSPEYNYYTHFWEEKASLVEQLEYLDKEMIKIDMDIEQKEREKASRNRRRLGTKVLEEEIAKLYIELGVLEQRHLEIAHEHALKIDNLEKEV